MRSLLTLCVLSLLPVGLAAQETKEPGPLKVVEIKRAEPLSYDRDVEPRRPPNPGPDEVVTTFIGHATFLIQAAGISVLIDPVYYERASPVSFAGPRRARAPGVRFDDLPPISLVLLSHNHYDHCDLGTLQLLGRRFHPSVVTPLGNGRLLRSAGIRQVEEIDWWATARPAPLPITLTRAQHFPARGPFARNRPLWGGFLVDAGGLAGFLLLLCVGFPAAAVAAETKNVKIMLDWIIQGTHAPDFVAQDKGYFKAAGVDESARGPVDGCVVPDQNQVHQPGRGPSGREKSRADDRLRDSQSAGGAPQHCLLGTGHPAPAPRAPRASPGWGPASLSPGTGGTFASVPVPVSPLPSPATRPPGG